MTRILEIREKIESFYARAASYVDMALRFVLLLFLLLGMAKMFGNESIFANVFVILLASLLGALLPLRALPIIVGAFSVGFAFTIGVDAGLVLLLLYATLYCLLLRFVPEDSLAFVLTPPSLAFGLPALVPVVAGLRRRPPSILAIACGSFAWHVLQSLAANAAAVAEIPSGDYPARIRLFFGSVLSDPGVVIEILALAAAFIVTYGIRRTGIVHAFTVGVVLGSLTCAFFIELGHLALGQSFQVLSSLLGTILVIAIGFVLQFFWFAPDFRRAESFDFMDDDFYYYVRVVPKERAYRRRLENAAGAPALAEEISGAESGEADLTRDAEAGFGEQPEEPNGQPDEEVSS